MGRANVDSQVKEAIRLIRAGNKVRALQLLTAAVELDDQHELAWLWLSVVVDNDEDRIIALQNALTINPDNKKARVRLLKIQNRQKETELTAEDWQKPPDSSAKIGFQSYSNFDDVWTHADQIKMCAYCAHEVKTGQKRCDNCRRSLRKKILTYSKPSDNFHVYWILVLSLSQLMLGQVIIDLMNRMPFDVVLAHGIFVPIFLILTPLVYRRFFWPYLIAQTCLFIVLLLLFTAEMFPSFTLIFRGRASVILLTPIAGLYGGFVRLIGYALRMLQGTAAAVGFFYGAFVIASDFSRDTIWMYARLNKDLRGSTAPSRAHAAAERYVKRGMWATAALHWRRAQAGAPTELRYYFRLTEAYLKLKFPDRALDTIDSALKIATAEEPRSRLYAMRQKALDLKT